MPRILQLLHLLYDLALSIKKFIARRKDAAVRADPGAYWVQQLGGKDTRADAHNPRRSGD